MLPDSPLRAYGWVTADALGRWMRAHRAVPRPELATDADLRRARGHTCPRCGHPAAGVLVLDRGPAWPATRLAICAGCAACAPL